MRVFLIASILHTGGVEPKLRKKHASLFNMQRDEWERKKNCNIACALFLWERMAVYNINSFFSHKLLDFRGDGKSCKTSLPILQILYLQDNSTSLPILQFYTYKIIVFLIRNLLSHTLLVFVLSLVPISIQTLLLKKNLSIWILLYVTTISKKPQNFNAIFCFLPFQE